MGDGRLLASLRLPALLRCLLPSAALPPLPLLSRRLLVRPLPRLLPGLLHLLRLLRPAVLRPLCGCLLCWQLPLALLLPLLRSRRLLRLHAARLRLRLLLPLNLLLGLLLLLTLLPLALLLRLLRPASCCCRRLRVLLRRRAALLLNLQGPRLINHRLLPPAALARDVPRGARCVRLAPAARLRAARGGRLDGLLLLRLLLGLLRWARLLLRGLLLPCCHRRAQRGFRGSARASCLGAAQGCWVDALVGVWHQPPAGLVSDVHLILCNDHHLR